MRRAKKLLVVEDNIAEARLIQATLDWPDAGEFEIECVTRLAQGIARLKQGPVDAILLDLALPDSEGLETFLQLHVAAPDTPTLILTGNADAELGVEAVKAGAQDYLIKGQAAGDALVRALRHAIERARTELQLRRSEERYRTLVDSLQEGVCATDRRGVATFVNPRLAEMLGYAARELVGQPLVSFMSARFAPEASGLIARCIAGSREQFACELVRKDGGVLQTLLETSPIPPSDRQGYSGTLSGIMDVSARLLDRARIVSLSKFPAEDPNPVMRVTADGMLEYANRASAPLLESWGIEVGHPVPVSIASLIRRGCETGSQSDFSLEIGERSFSVLVAPIAGASYANIYGLDVTAQRRLEEQLRQAHKMDAIGRLAGGIAHDFNNLLSIMMSGADFLLDELTPDDPRRESAAEIRAAALRASSLTHQLLAFSRKQAMHEVTIDLKTVAGDLEKMMRRLLGEDVELTSAFEAGPACVRAGIGEMEQVFLNLAANARDAMPHGGKLSIRVSTLDAQKAGTHKPADLKPGRYVAITVTDTGVGMDDAVLSRLFEPFFTTKVVGKGTGFGLSIVYGIIKHRGGYISVDSRPGAGTTFNILLPYVEEEAEEGEPVQGASAGAPQARGVLVVEDDEVLRKIITRILRQGGYVVLEAEDAADARALCAAQGARIDLVLADVVMPETSGPDLARELKGILPGLKVLFMSGFTHSTIANHGLHEGDALLEKPFGTSSLLRAVGDAFSEAPVK